MDSPRPIRVLVADDSAFMRKTISTILNGAEDIEVVATARDGLEAVRKTNDYKPDVITLDIEMPRLDGLQALGSIMSECPTPVVIVSAYTDTGGETTLKALEYGAVDFVCKPSGPISLDLEKVSQDLIAKVRTAAGVDVSRLKFLEVERLERYQIAPRPLLEGRHVVVIASSTGGPRALYDVIPKLPANLPAAARATLFCLGLQASVGITPTFSPAKTCTRANTLASTDFSSLNRATIPRAMTRRSSSLCMIGMATCSRARTVPWTRPTICRPSTAASLALASHCG